MFIPSSLTLTLLHILSIFIVNYHCFLKLRVRRLVMRSIDLTKGYAIAAGGILLILALVKSLSHYS